MKINLLLLALLLFLLGGCGQPVEGGLLFKTASPNLNVVFAIPGMQAAPVPDIDGPIGEPIVLPEAIDAEEEGQQDCDIAGNIGANGEPIYHLPSGQYYSRVKIDLTRSNADGVFEQWFCSPEQAEAAGFRPSSR